MKNYPYKFQVKTYLKLASYLNKRGEKNLLIRGRIKFNSTKVEIEIPVYDEFLAPLSVTPIVFNSNSLSYDILLRTRLVQQRFEFAIRHFLSIDKPLFLKNLKDFVYVEMEKEKIHNPNMTNDPKIVDFFQPDIPEEYKESGVSLDVYNEFTAMPASAFYDDETGAVCDEDIAREIASATLVAHQKKVNRIELAKSLKKMSYDERYQKDLFDKNNIFEVFGWCLSTNLKTGQSWVCDSYKSLIVRLEDFRVNECPAENIDKFNMRWVEEFILFLKHQGYSSHRIIKPNPFSISIHNKDLVMQDRKPYSYTSFEKQIKHLKTYVNLLQRQGFIGNNQIDTRQINASEYAKKATVINRVSHHLNERELKLLLSAKLSGRSEQARVMFLMQTFVGGLRNDEMLNKYFAIRTNTDGEYYFTYYSRKVDRIEENPTIEGYSDILLEQIGYALPKFLDVVDYREELKKLAEKLGLNRIIRYRTQSMENNGKSEIQDKAIYEIINPYWARKSFVNLCGSLGWTNEQITRFTGHRNIATIEKYYLSDLSAEDKRAIINKSNKVKG